MQCHWKYSYSQLHDGLHRILFSQRNPPSRAICAHSAYYSGIYVVKVIPDTAGVIKVNCGVGCNYPRTWSNIPSGRGRFKAGHRQAQQGIHLDLSRAAQLEEEGRVDDGDVVVPPFRLLEGDKVLVLLGVRDRDRHEDLVRRQDVPPVPGVESAVHLYPSGTTLLTAKFQGTIGRHENL